MRFAHHLGLLFLVFVALRALGGLWYAAGMAHAEIGGLPLGIGFALGIGLMFTVPRMPRGFWASGVGVTSAVALGVGLRAGLAYTWDAPLISDFLEYHQLGLSVSAGGPWFSEQRPMGFPLLLAAGRAVGLGGEAVNVLLAGVGGLALWGFTHRLAGGAAAGAAVWLWALCPGQALMVLPIGSEIAYATVFVLALLALLLSDERPRQAVLAAVAAGGLLGLSQYIRPTSLVLLPPFLLYLALLPLRRARQLALATALLFSCGLVLTPAMAYNHEMAGVWSPSTSNWGGWSLLVGANQQHGGTWNEDDVALMAGRSSLREMNADAATAAQARIAADPVGYVKLMLRKLDTMWDSEAYAAYWALGPQTPAVPVLLSQAAYVLIVGLAIAGWFRLAPGPEATLLAGIFGLIAALHMVVEVQSRYHFYVVPLFIALAGLGAAGRQEDTA